MTEDMPRKLPRYVEKERTRHGRVAFYFRVGKGKRTRLPSPSSPDFDAAYLDALNAAEPTEPKKVGAGSLAWLIAQYRESGTYLGLSAATRRQRDNIFKGVIEKAGQRPYKAVTRRSIVQGREDRKATPAQARHFLDAVRGLFRWALDAEHVSEDPTLGVKNLKLPKGDGFAPWTDEEVEAFEARWPEGTKERVWLHVLLYTGLRRGDAVVVGRQHVRNGVATLKTEKTGTEVSIPILPQLARTLAAGPTGDMAFIVGERGQPLTKESFGNMFREACNTAGVKKSAHGLRKVGAARAAEAGASENELDALFGWTGGQMAGHYTRAANRKRLAQSASDKIVNAVSPHPSSISPHPKKDAGNS